MKNLCKPVDPLVSEMVDELDADQREDFDERAGIIEFDAHLPRAHAECLALIDVLRRNPSVLTGTTVLEVELDGASQWLVTTDLGFARRHLCDIGAVEIAVLALTDVIHEQYGGIAMLTTFG